MQLLRDQVAVGILEWLNLKYDLQGSNISINNKTNIYRELDLDELDSQFRAWEFNILFNIAIPEDEEESFLDTSFKELVDYIYNLGATVSTAPREQIYWIDLPMNEPDKLEHIYAVLSGVKEPEYTLNPYYNCDKTGWPERYNAIRKYQQDQQEKAQAEEAAHEAVVEKAWFAYVLERENKKKKRRRIIAIAVALVISSLVVVHYAGKKRKQNPRHALELFNQTKQKMGAVATYPIQKAK